MAIDAQRLAEVEQTATRFAARHIEPLAAEWDHGDPSFPLFVFARGREAGFDRLMLPESAGGYGFSPAEVAALVAALARTCAGHAMVIGVHAALVATLHDAGAQAALAQVLASEQPIAVALPEPLSAGEFETAVSAMLVGKDQYHLNGPAGLAINIAPAGFIIAFAKDAAGSPLALLAQAGQNDVAVGAAELTLGLRAMPLAEVSFADHALPSAQVIAAGEPANAFYRALLANLCQVVAAAAVGVMQAARTQALKYMAERYQGGKMIIDHEHLREMIGVMTATLGAKFAITEAAVLLTTDAVQLLGGYGYMRDYGLEKRMRDAAMLALLPVANPRAALLLAALEKKTVS
jgi:acyl-CoA dehydrogenase